MLVFEQLLGVLLLLVCRRVHVVRSLSQKGSRASIAVGATIIRHVIIDGSRISTCEVLESLH